MMSEQTIKLIITGMIFVMCSVSMIHSKGKRGIGWFVLGLLIVWG